MTMAHDPTRSWPTGKGPDNTSIPGAAWLELLDGQAFPVVGAGVMVRDGNLWTPASSSNPLHVRAQALEQLIGALNATKETNPDAASANMLALLRGLIAIVGKESTLGQILAALGAPAQESTLVDVLAALTTLAGTVDSGAQKVTLTGREIVEEVLLPRGVRTTSDNIRVDIPTGARYAVINGYVYGRTGTFADGQGFRVTAVTQGFYSSHAHHGVGARTEYSNVSQQIHLLVLGPEVSRPSSDVVITPSKRWVQYVAEAVPLAGRLYVAREISGTFGEGEGIDSEVRITWYM